MVLWGRFLPLKTSKRLVLSSNEVVKGDQNQIGWELRPGGMLVQKRMIPSGEEEEATSSSPPMIKIKVSHGSSYHHDITVPAQCTFGDLKRILANETGLEPKEQRLLFRGKEKDDEECLDMVGVEDMSKVILLDDPASKERKIREMMGNQNIQKACEAVEKVRAEVDKLSEKVVALEAIVHGGTKKVEEMEFKVLAEMFMMQLLKLDSIEADGDAKVQRKIEVRRVQGFVDILDSLKARNSNPFSSNGNAVSASTKWEAFESGVGSLSSPTSLRSSTRITQDWVVFD